MSAVTSLTRLASSSTALWKIADRCRCSTTILPLEVLASVFSYLFPRVARRLILVNRKWHDLVILGDVPWTISPPFRIRDGFNYRMGMRPYEHRPIPHPNACMVHQASRIAHFASNAIAFKFGPLPPTRLLMQSMQSMRKLKRIQMPTCIGERMGDAHSQFIQRPDLYSAECVESVISHADITHLAVTHLPCILSVCSFPHLTSLLISFGILDPIPCMRAVDLFMTTVVEDINVLPQLQHLGLHHSANQLHPDFRCIAIDTIVELLKKRPDLITLSLTGESFVIEPAEIEKLVRPHCGLRSLCITVDQPDDAPWPVSEILKASQVNLIVLCDHRLSKPILWAMFVAGFEPLRERKVEIDGQYPYTAHPFRRVGVDVVWGLTAGALFAE
jgi:hypothetical protein